MPSSLASAALVLAPLTPLPAQQGAAVRELHAQILPPSEFANGLIAVDLDQDGDLDLVRSAPLRVLRNDGLARFTAELPLPFSGGGRLDAADVDGDGDVDLAQGGGQAKLFRNDAGALAVAEFPPVSPSAVALGDLDGDGDADALIASQVNAKVYANDGAGGFALAALPEVPADEAQLVRLVDVEGDGDLDVFVGNLGVDGLFKNDGAGGLTDASTAIPSTDTATLGARFADVDLDGDLDLVRKYAYDPLLAYLNDGAGVFAQAPPAPGLPATPTSGDVDLADVDSDGVLDAVLGVAGEFGIDAQNLLLLGDGAGSFVDATAALPKLPLENTKAVVLADLDGDGDADLATASNWQATRLLLGDGHGAFRDVSSSLPPSAHSAFSVGVADFDGNGRPDVLVGTDQHQPGRLYLGQPDGTWTVGPEPPEDAVRAGRTLIGDLDQDGDPDAVWVGSYALSVGTFGLFNQGGGVFTSKHLTEGIDVRDGELGDLDLDGDLDLALAGGGLSFTTRNDGTGSFGPKVAFAALPIQAIDLGDLDGDGVLDLWAGLDDGEQRVWYGSLGAGLTFHQAPESPVSLTLDVALADFDQDGDLDSAVAGFGTSLFRGTGATWVAEPLPQLAGRWIAVDFDDDGDRDLVGTPSVGYAPHASGVWLENDGAGTFAEHPLWGADQVLAMSSIAVADVDLDADLDVVAAGAQDRVLSNLTRHVAWRRLPSLGEPLVLDVWGAAGAPWLLAWSAATASVPLEPFGTLRLAPAQLQPLAAGAFGGHGTSAFTTTLPSAPALAGLTVYVQALCGAPLGFSNLEAIPLTTF